MTTLGSTFIRWELEQRCAGWRFHVQFEQCGLELEQQHRLPSRKYNHTARSYNRNAVISSAIFIWECCPSLKIGKTWFTRRASSQRGSACIFIFINGIHNKEGITI